LNNNPKEYEENECIKYSIMVIKIIETFVLVVFIILKLWENLSIDAVKLTVIHMD
jgi:hypothetical protein